MGRSSSRTVKLHAARRNFLALRAAKAGPAPGPARVTRATVAALAAAVEREGGPSTRWRSSVTIIVSTLRHRTSRVPAGFGLMVACPACPRRHQPLWRRPSEPLAAFLLGRATKYHNACPHWGDKSVREAGPVFRKGDFVGYYRGKLGASDATGDYVLEVGSDLSSSVPSCAPVTLDGAGRHGSLLKYCNGCESATDRACNINAMKSPTRPAVLEKAKFGLGVVPVFAWRDVFAHDECVPPYGKAFCANIPDFHEYVMDAGSSK